MLGLRGWGCGAHGAEEASGSPSGREAAPCCALGQLCSGAGAEMPLGKHWHFSVKVERGLGSDTQAMDFLARAPHQDKSHCVLLAGSGFLSVMPELAAVNSVSLGNIW